MRLRSPSAVLHGLLISNVLAKAEYLDDQIPLKPLTALEKANLKAACPDYSTYSKYAMHGPLSDGPMALPYQRPSKHCRTFESPLVEKVIDDLTSQMVDKDLARLFENAFPNTLDTTVRWHTDGTEKLKNYIPAKWGGQQSFIVTGDINAEWLRDSTNQLAQYQVLAKKDRAIHNLILGAINTQAEFVITSPYCNAFQPPPPSGLQPVGEGSNDNVHPAYEHSFVFECKWEIDSLAAFLSLSNQFFNHTGSTEFYTKRWSLALDTILAVIEQQSEGTFTDAGNYRRNEYIFQRWTNTGTETLNLGGIGNPVAGGTGLVRSAFRPSDDATILPFFIPGNAMMAVELERAAEMILKKGKREVAMRVKRKAQKIREGIMEHGVVDHKIYGEVFAYEVDGYGSHILMDDANLPSLLALPLMGFCSSDDKVYQNTRTMILEKAGNPYFLTGQALRGIGGPHVGVTHAWPMSLLVQAMTSDSDKEIMRLLEDVKTTGSLGLIHESVNVNAVRDYTRSWFAWANSVFAQTIIDLARRKPHLLFGKGARPYVIDTH